MIRTERIRIVGSVYVEQSTVTEAGETTVTYSVAIGSGHLLLTQKEARDLLESLKEMLLVP